MTLKVRRVITGHDNSGKAIVKIDEIVHDLKVGRPGAMVAPIWTTEGFPVNNDGHDDASTRQVGTTLAGGTILRVVEFSPGVQARNHRTDSIDYAIIMSGEIDMERIFRSIIDLAEIPQKPLNPLQIWWHSIRS